MTTVVLRGGSRDGETTTVADEVTRLYAVSDAPGLLDRYDATEETAEVAGNADPVLVFAWAGQEPADGVAPQAIHMPPGR